MARDRENLFCIKLYHRAFLIFTVNREEVQKLSDVLLAAVKVTLVAGRLRESGHWHELLKNRKGASRIEIEHIGVLFSVGITVFIMEQARILRAESRLHIEGRTRHIGQHKNRRPFGDRHAGSQLPHG